MRQGERNQKIKQEMTELKPQTMTFPPSSDIKEQQAIKSVDTIISARQLMLKYLLKQRTSQDMSCVWRPGSVLITPSREVYIDIEE